MVPGSLSSIGLKKLYFRHLLYLVMIRDRLFTRHLRSLWPRLSLFYGSPESPHRMCGLTCRVIFHELHPTFISVFSALALLACDAGWLYNPLICAVGMSRFIAHQFGIHPVHDVISTFVFFTCNDGFLLSAHYCVAFCHGLSYLNCKTSLSCVSGIKFIRL